MRPFDGPPGLENLRETVKANLRMATSVEGIYAIGDVIGGMMLLHAALAKGIVTVDNIMGKVRGTERLPGGRKRCKRRR